MLISDKDQHIIDVVEQHFNFDEIIFSEVLSRISVLEKKLKEKEIERETINKAFKDVSFQDFIKLFCVGR